MKGHPGDSGGAELTHCALLLWQSTHICRTGNNTVSEETSKELLRRKDGRREAVSDPIRRSQILVVLEEGVSIRVLHRGIPFY